MSIEQELQQEQVSRLDLSHFVLIEIGTAVEKVVQEMREKKQTCAIVTDQKELVGIFTDHDIMVKIADDPETWQLPIDDFVTPTPLTVKATDPVSKAIGLMEDKRFRNVPVLDDQDQVVGNLTHYAMIKYLADRFPKSVYNQPPVPDRQPEKRNGA